MKARQDFVIHVDKNGTRVPHYSGDSMEGKSEISFKKGDDVPEEYVADLIRFNTDLIDVPTLNEKPVLSEEDQIKYNLKKDTRENPIVQPSPAKDSATPQITEQELIALTKSKQEQIIKELTTSKVPTTEKGRISLILQLQKEGKNIFKMVRG